MGIVGVEAHGRGQTIQLEGGAAGIVGRPIQQSRITAPHSIDGCQDVEPVVAVELGRVNVRLQVLIEGLPQNLLIETDGVEAHPCCGGPTFDQLHDGLGKLEQGRQCRVNQLRGRHAGDDQRLRCRNDVRGDAAAQIDALNLNEAVIRPDRRKLQRLVISRR